MACGSAKNAESSATDLQQNTAAAASNEIWQSIYFDWEAGEVYPEDACAQGRVTLKRDQTLEVQDCGEMRRAKINGSELEAFESRLATVLSSVNDPIQCNGDAIADYAQDWRLVDGNGKLIQVYQFNIENTCGRVANVDQINDYLYELREKYFPRAEEGEYEN